MALLVRLREGPQEPERTLIFAGSPVRLGRNSLNDLPLSYGFVSDWHGVVRFDRNEIVYVDLGSRNGTLMDERRVQERVPVRVEGPETKLMIGPIEFHLSWTDRTDAAAFERPSIKTQFATGLPNRLSEVLAGVQAASERADRTPSAAVSEPQMVVDRVRESYEVYRRAWRDCLATLRSEIESLPPARREIITFFVANELPQLVRAKSLHKL